MKSSSAFFAALAFVAAIHSPANALQAGKTELPPGYKVRADDPAADLSKLSFETMTPGWHITTGPAVILYDPARAASGEYRVVSQSFLFDPGRLNEAYGIFIGGRDLEGTDQTYSYFVIRRSGDFLIRRRVKNTVFDLVEWTASPAIVEWDERGESQTAKNALSIDVGRDTVRFLINEQVVATLRRAEVFTDGIIGLRANHSLNLHVSSLEVTQK